MVALKRKRMNCPVNLRNSKYVQDNARADHLSVKDYSCS